MGLEELVLRGSACRGGTEAVAAVVWQALALATTQRNIPTRRNSLYLTFSCVGNRAPRHFRVSISVLLDADEATS
jgi:hypothetical protein